MRATPTPWGFASLPAARYRSGFEPGCSIGVLTRLLAGRCDMLLATDVVEAGLAQARARTADLPHVTVERRAVPDDWPPGTFELVVLSELGYYQRVDGLQRLLRGAVESLVPGGPRWRSTGARSCRTTADRRRGARRGRRL